MQEYTIRYFFQALLENLMNLKLITNAGKMGKLFDRTNLRVPNGCSNFGLLEFDQMESSTSGGMEEDDYEQEENGLEISPWIPSKKHRS